LGGLHLAAADGCQAARISRVARGTLGAAEGSAGSPWLGADPLHRGQLYRGAQPNSRRSSASSVPASNIYYLFIYTFILFLLLAQSKTFAERVRKANAANGVFARQFTRYAKQIQTQYTTQTFSNFVSALAILAVLIVFGVDFA
jgi:hypothetical protein